MIDFGLAGLFERFEKEFGRTATRALLALVGITITVVSLGLIAQFLWALYQWTNDTIEGTSTVWLVGKAVGFVSGLFFILGLPMFFSWMFESKDILRRAQQMFDRAVELEKKAAQMHQEAKSIHQELTELRAEALQAKGSTDEVPDSQSPQNTSKNTQP